MKKGILKSLVVIIAVFMSASVFAQEAGDKAAGGSLNYGSGDGWSSIGIGAKFRYNVTSPIRLEGVFTYFLKKDYVSMWDFSVNAHYLFKAGEKLTVYPLAGLGLSKKSASGEFMGYDYNVSDSEFGLNLGGGLDYDLSENMVGNVELRYGTGSELIILSAGVVFKF